MRLLDVTNLNIAQSTEHVDLNKSIVRQTSNIDIADSISNDKISINIDKEEVPSTLTYSGHGMLEVYPANLSISYVVGHEQRHANHNRLKAAAKNENLQQDIKYNLSFKDGKMIASGGVTEAVFTPQSSEGEQPPSTDRIEASADHTTIRDLADIFTSSFKFVERSAPNVTLLDSVSSGIRVDDAVNSINKIKEDNPNPVEIDLKLNRSFIENKVNTWGEMRKRLERLSLSVDKLASEDSFNIHKVSSTNKDVLTADSNINTKDSSHSVAVSNIFIPKKVVSDIQYDPYTSLNLQGSVKINGFELSIETADSLNDIKDKINLGEDINGNSQLDLAEDLNGNGRLDNFIIGDETKVFAIFEDIDSDRVIDGTEDTNNNERIDGGSMALKVSASIENNQLILSGIGSGDIHLSEDENQVLSTLGFLTTDINNNTVLKHNTADSQDYIILNQNMQNAQLSVNGREYRKDTNKISDIIPDLTLNLKDKSDQKVEISISKDLNKGLNIINEFVDSFNSSMIFINDQLEFRDSMKGEVSVQRMRDSLVKSVEDINTQPDTGIKLENRDKNSNNELSIINMLKGLKEGLNNMLKIPLKGENSIFSNIDDIGIITKKDDTLSVDIEKLKNALKENPQNLFSMFSGMAVNMDRAINKSLDNNTGEIETKQIALVSLMNSTSALTSIRDDIYKVKASFENAKSIGTIIV